MADPPRDDVPAQSDPASEEALANHVRAERVRFVFIQSALPIFFSPLAAAILSAALWHAVAHGLLVGWTIGLTVIAIIRVTLVRTYPRVNPSIELVKRWERTFVGSILLVDLWWGIGGLLLLVPGHLAERALVFSFVMLMAGGHSASYAAHPMTVMLGVLALALPITLRFALMNDVFHRAMAFASLMYVAASFRSIRTLDYFFGRNHRLAHELKREKDRAESLARTDFLTELNNRRAFYEMGEAALRHSRRYGHPAAVLMTDVDHFKSINDRYGHAAGDAVLRAVATLIRENLRDTDIAGRLGGEEFAVLLPETKSEEALAIAERLRSKVGSLTVSFEDKVISFTTSVGVASLRGEESLDDGIQRADKALYDAKHGGRNRVVKAVSAGGQVPPDLR